MPLSRLVYECQIELHDPAFFASREIGKFFETAPYFHNYALTYALGLACSPYHSAQQIPQYAAHLKPLNDRGIYVTAAASPDWSRTTDTWSYQRSEGYFAKERSNTDTRVNLPLIGRANQIAIGSTFRFFVISLEALNLPRWIRLGKWLSKAELMVEAIHQPTLKQGPFYCEHPLNGLDLLSTYQPQAYSVVNMPPCSLCREVHAFGEYLDLGEIQLPVLEYQFL